MGRCLQRLHGGIAGLARELGAHGGAIEYDLITRAGMSLDDVPARLSWRALSVFVRHLDVASAYVREVEPEVARWVAPESLRPMLADIYDLLSTLNHNLVAANSKHRPRKPKPYPRPGKQDKGTVVGKDPIPIKDFDEWWNGGSG